MCVCVCVCVCVYIYMHASMHTNILKQNPPYKAKQKTPKHIKTHLNINK